MELTLADFALAVVLGTFIVVPVIAMYSRALHSKVEKQARADLVICRLCLHAFQDESHVHIVHCPSCKAANEKGRSRRLG